MIGRRDGVIRCGFGVGRKSVDRLRVGIRNENVVVPDQHFLASTELEWTWSRI